MPSSCRRKETYHLEVCDTDFYRLDRRRRPGECGPIVTIVELDEKVAGVDRLIVCDDDTRDEPRDLRRDHRHVAADVGVVGRLYEAPEGPRPLAVSDRGNCKVSYRARYRPTLAVPSWP